MRHFNLMRAFQYVDDRYLDIVEQERKTGGEEPSGTGEGNAEINSDQGTSGFNGEISGGKPQGVISLAGYQGSSDWQALAEWQTYLSDTDEESGGPSVESGRLDDSLLRYSCYQVHSREMADRMEEIAAKYGLRLHSRIYDLQTYPELITLCGDFAGEGIGEIYPECMYEDGTFQTGGTVYVPDNSVWDFTLLRSVRGTFHDAMLEIGEIGAYQEWQYEAACGVTVNLALGPHRALLLADLEDCFVTVSVLSIIQPVSAGEEDGVGRADLEALADEIDFTALSPVVPPKPDGAADSADRAPGEEAVWPSGESAGLEAARPSGEPAGPEAAASLSAQDRAAGKLYAAILRNLLYSGLLPDGTALNTASWSAAADGNRFAVADVDGDGGKELVVLCEDSIVAGMSGYIIGYDREADTTYIQLEEFPVFEFLKNGNLKALDSHNQTDGDMWPYSLYRYLPESDSYEFAGHAHAEDRLYAGEDYHSEADVSGTGTVYYVGDDGWGTTPIDEADYLAWLAEKGGDSEALEIPYLPLTEENILTVERWGDPTDS